MLPSLQTRSLQESLGAQEKFLLAKLRAMEKKHASQVGGQCRAVPQLSPVRPCTRPLMLPSLWLLAMQAMQAAYNTGPWQLGSTAWCSLQFTRACPGVERLPCVC